jgi:hypothetical protein
MNHTLILFHAVMLSAALLGTGCGKDSSKPAPNTTEPATAPQAAAPKPAAVATKQLASLPLQAEVASSWTLREDKVSPGGGAGLTTKTADILIAKDGVEGIKKTTLEDEKKLMSSLSSAPEEVTDEKLADGWLLSYKIPGILPYHATVVREIAGQAYRCVITTEQAAERGDAIAICKSMKPL